MRPSPHTLASIIVGVLLLALMIQIGRWDAEADASFARYRSCEIGLADCRSAR